MKRVIKCKNYICFILVLFMLITGICLREAQMDSSFALCRQESGCLTLDKGSFVLQDTMYAAEDANPQDAVNKGNNRLNVHKLLRDSKAYDGNSPVREEQHAIIHFLQELDIRLCRTENLTQVFNVLYIHHQDGVKGAGLFF